MAGPEDLYEVGALVQIFDRHRRLPFEDAVDIDVGAARIGIDVDLTGLDLATALFSLTPGGVAEMVAAAQDTAADITAVAMLQLLRLAGVLLLAPAIIDWLFGGGG